MWARMSHLTHKHTFESEIFGAGIGPMGWFIPQRVNIPGEPSPASLAASI